MERLTDPDPVPDTTKTRQQKAQRKVAAGRAGAATRKAKEEHLYEELQAAKVSYHIPADPIEGEVSPVVRLASHVATQPEKQNHDWTRWIIGECFVGGAIMLLRKLQLQQTKRPKSVAAGPAIL